MKSYTYLGSSNGKKFCIQGIDVFTHTWRSMGECDIVLDPNTKKPYSFSVYRVDTDTKSITFLAGQFPNGDWGFYQEASENDFIF